MGNLIDKRKEFEKRKKQNEKTSHGYQEFEEFLFSQLNKRVNQQNKKQEDTSLMEGSDAAFLETYRDVRFFLTDLQEKFLMDVDTKRWTSLGLKRLFHEDEDYFKVFIQTAFTHYGIQCHIQKISLSTWKTNGDVVFYITQRLFQQKKESENKI